MQWNIEFPFSQSLSSFSSPLLSLSSGARTGGRVPLLHKRPLSGHSPLSLSILPTLAQAAQPSHHLKVLDFFPPYISYLEWGLGNLGRCIGKSNIFCARVLWTEILALNWIRCRRSNSKTMKRENSEAKPLLKWLSRKIKQFQKPTFPPLCQCLRI